MTLFLLSDAVAQEHRADQAQVSRIVQPFDEWSLEIPEPGSGTLDFDRFPYQREIYQTGNLPEMVCAKATQVGLTTLCLRWALWIADELSGTVMYVFPTRDLVYRFSDHRIKPVIAGSQKLRERVAPDDPDNKGMKKIGAGYVMFVGSVSRTELDSVPARAVVLDEYDELSQNNLPVVERRMGAQEHPMIRRIGVPTLQNYGIEARYRETDMRRWVVKCEFCNEWQTVTWDNLRYDPKPGQPGEYVAWRVCKACERMLDVTRGEWVPEHPERSKRGYHVPRLIVPGANMGDIVKGRLSESQDEQRAHYNRDLAEPFETAESRLSTSAIASCRRAGIHLVESYVGSNWVTMGIDVSTVRGLHVRISEHLNERDKRVLWVGVIDAMINPNPDEADLSALRRLAQMMDVYHVHMACIDHLPDGLFARAFCAGHPGRSYMVAYQTDPVAREMLVIPKAGVVGGVVTAKRTELITLTLDRFRWQRNLLPLHEPLPKGREGKTYEEHLRNVVQMRRKDKKGREFYAYESTGPDDFLHAEVYDEVATRVLQQRLMEQAVSVGANSEQEVAAPNPTGNMGNYEDGWDGKPTLGQPADGLGGSYGEGWDDDYHSG